jgi:hypothetical protein
MNSDQSIATTVSVASIIILGIMGVIYKTYEKFVYKYAFSIRNTIELSELAGEMRVGRFGIFIALWMLLLISNVAIYSIIFGKCDYLTQMKLTSILYLGIVGTTFVLIGLIPSLVEIFENTFGLFIVTTPPMSWLVQHEEIMKVFKSRLFQGGKGIVLPFDSFLPLFNINTFLETFDKIPDKPKSVPDEGDEAAGEEYDFYFDYEEMCTSTDEESKSDSKQHFRNALFKLCFAKYNAGHFAWVYLATIVTILSVISVK